MNDYLKSTLKGGLGFEIDEVEVWGSPGGGLADNFGGGGGGFTGFDTGGNSGGNGSLTYYEGGGSSGGGGSYDVTPGGGQVVPIPPTVNPTEPTYDGGTIETVVINVNTSNVNGIGNVLNGMFTALGIGATQAEVGAAFAKLSIPGLTNINRGISAVGILFNGYELSQDPYNLTDMTQIGLGIASFIPGPIGLTAGSVLTLWEIYEIYQKNMTQSVPRTDDSGAFYFVP